MWVFTQTGFISAVRHYSDKGTVVVRARDAESLASLAARSDQPIEKSPYNDYPYRVHVAEDVYKDWLTTTVSDMDYTNFKDRVHDTRGDHFADTLMTVWSVMHDVEDKEARK